MESKLDNSRCKMNTHKLTLEMSEKLFQELTLLADMTEESVEYLAVRIIATRVPSLLEKERKFNELLEGIKPDTIHGEIGLSETREYELR